MAKQESKGTYKRGEIVVVNYQDAPSLPIHKYIGYVRNNVNLDSSGTLPLENVQRDFEALKSRSAYKSLDLIFSGVKKVTRMKRSREFTKPRKGQLYEAIGHDPHLASMDSDRDDGLSFRIVGCYVGTMSSSGHNYEIFSNVFGDDPEILKLRGMDKTHGRRVFNRLRVNSHLQIKPLSRK